MRLKFIHFLLGLRRHARNSIMTPFEVTVLSVTLNAAGIVPSAKNCFPPPNVIGNIFRGLAHL